MKASAADIKSIPRLTEPEAQTRVRVSQDEERWSLAQMASIVALAAAAVFLVLLGALHLIEPELDPSWRVISEYALGDHGWVMALAFLSLGISCVALAVALWGHVVTMAGRLGILMLIVTGVGLALAATFTTDPPTTPHEERTTRGRIHETGAMLDLIPYAAFFIGWSLGRRPSAWFRMRRTLFCAAGVAMGGTVLFVIAMALLLPADGTLGPGVPIGWPNRVMIMTHAAWVMTLAWLSIRVGEPAP